MAIGKQLLRPAPSVAAKYREVNDTCRRADRAAEFQIIVQELEQSALWLEVLDESLASVDGSAL